MRLKNNSKEIQISRIYDAPVKAVWEAWTDPVQVAKWWGPRGFSITTHSKDLRVGGTWVYTMHGPDGTDYPNITTYYTVDKYSQLEYDHGANENQPALFRVKVLFAEAKGKTKMDMTMTLASPEAAQEIFKFIRQAGGNSTWDRLAEYLDKQSSGNDVFVINRSFAVNVEKMFDVWTNPNHFCKWLPPTGFTMSFMKADIRPGGKTLYEMTNGKDVTMYGRAEYLEINKPNRIVYTQQFCTKDEKISRHPLLTTWPETMLTTVELTPEGDHETRITVTWKAYGNVSAAELAEFVKMRSGMTQGWTGSFDKLEDYLKVLK